MSVANSSPNVRTDTRFATRRTATFAEMAEAMQRIEFCPYVEHGE